jgi:uncharacterized membrane protein
LTIARIAVGQSYELKDRHGIKVLTISDVRMFRYSEYFKQDIPEFKAQVTNVSGAALDFESGYIRAAVHKADGSIVEFQLGSPDRFDVLPKPTPHEVAHCFFEPWPFVPADFVSVDFSLSASWVSPEDRRIIAQQEANQKAKEAAAEAEASRRSARELKKQEAEYKAWKDAEAIRTAAKEMKIRAACKVIYQKTADTKVKDLTVREEQQVRACQGLNLYPPQE